MQTISKYDQVVNACSNILYDYGFANNALTYINNRLNKSTQKKFSFGYFPTLFNLNTLTSVINEQDLIDLNLLYKDDNGPHSFLEHHNLILPYRDVYGRIIALVGRTLLSEEQRGNIPKYKNTVFKKSRHLFGLFEAKDSIIEKQYVYLVEGQFDCIKAHSCNINNVVALGSSNMSFEQLVLILRYTNRIKILLDNDDAGNLGREHILEKYGKYANISNAYVPKGFKDLDEFLEEFKEESDLERYLIY